MRSNIFVGDSLAVNSDMSHSYFSSDSQTCESWLWEEKHHKLNTDPDCIPHPGWHYSSPSRCCHPSGMDAVFKRPFCQVSCFRVMDKIIIQMNSMHTNLVLPFLSCRMISLVRSYAVWNVTVGIRHSLSPQRVIWQKHCRKGRQICIHSKFLFQWEQSIHLLGWK